MCTSFTRSQNFTALQCKRRLLHKLLPALGKPWMTLRDARAREGNFSSQKRYEFCHEAHPRWRGELACKPLHNLLTPHTAPGGLNGRVQQNPIAHRTAKGGFSFRSLDLVGAACPGG